jgi:hypothetical protein
VHVNLTEQGVPQKARFGVIQRYAGLIAGGFDTYNQHNVGPHWLAEMKTTRILAETRNPLADSSNKH